MIALPVHPARKTHGLAGVGVAKFAAGVGAVGMHAGPQGYVFGRTTPARQRS